MSERAASRDVGALRDRLVRRFRTVSSVLRVDDRELSLIHPANAEDLILFADAERATQANYEERKSKPRKKSAGNQLVGK